MVSLKAADIWATVRRVGQQRPLPTVWQHRKAIFGFGLIGLLALQSGVLIYNAVRGNDPVLGMRLQHKTVSWISDAKLAATVRQDVRLQEAKPLTIIAGTIAEQVTPRQLGAYYNPSKIVDKTIRIGRQGSPWQRLIDQDAALFGHRNVSISFDAIDPAVADSYFQKLNKRIEQPPHDAHFVYRNQQVVLADATAGRRLNIKKAELALHATGSSQIQPDHMTVPLVYSPATFRASDLKPLLPEARRIVAEPLTLRAGSYETTLRPEELTDMLVPTKQIDPLNPRQTETTISFDDTKLSAAIDKVAGPATQNPTPTIVAGKRVITRGTNGTHVDGTHAKIDVLSSLMKRQLGATAAQPTSPAPTPSAQPTVSQEVVFHIDELPAPTVNQFSYSPSDKYPAQVDSQKMVYLTFDDGPGGYTEQVLDTLKKYNVHAIFFLVGRNATLYPNTVKRIKQEGHTIANHSYTHTDLTKLSDAALAGELNHTQATLGALNGTPPTLFRPPYGSFNPKVYAAMSNAHLDLMMWSVDPRDWSKPGAAEITKRVVNAATPGCNILLHSIHQQTADALPAIIEGLRAKGFTLN